MQKGRTVQNLGFTEMYFNSYDIDCTAVKEAIEFYKNYSDAYGTNGMRLS